MAVHVAPVAGASSTASPLNVSALTAAGVPESVLVPRRDAVLGEHGGIMLPGPSGEDFEAYNTWAHVYLTAMHERYGDAFVLLRDGKPCVFVRSPEMVRRVLLTADFAKTWDSSRESTESVDYVMNLVQPVLKRTVFNLHGEDNAARRKALRPTFLAAGHFVEAFEAAVEQQIASWPERGEIDVLAAAHDILRLNILTAICGDDYSFATGTLTTFHEVMDYFLDRYSVAMHDKNVTDEDEVQMARLADAGRVIVAGFRQMVDERHGGDFAKLNESQRRSVLGCMMRTGEYADEECAATLVNLLIAGGEAPASVLGHTLEEMAYNPAMWQALQAEVDAKIGPDGPIAANVMDTKKTPMIDGCAREGLRLFAPATLVQRVALKDVEIADGVTIPKGTCVGICVSAVHGDAAQFPDPDTFNPNRDNNNYVQLEKGSSFSTFSSGPRGCPGRHVAVTAVRVSLAAIARKYNVSPAEAPRTGHHTMVPKFIRWATRPGINVNIERRETPGGISASPTAAAAHAVPQHEDDLDLDFDSDAAAASAAAAGCPYAAAAAARAAAAAAAAGCPAHQ